MRLITEQYRALNSREHAAQNGYGVNGQRHLPAILKLVDGMQCTTALDYGCGQASLSKAAKRVSPVQFRNYDPAIAEHSALPEPADLVVCTDVLEHVEPECLYDVLQHITSLTLKVAYLEIACRPAKRVLMDGRNAHINQQNGGWWLDTILSMTHFDIREYRANPGHSVVMVCQPGGTLWT